MFLGVSNESGTQLEFTAGDGLQFILYCSMKKKYISSIKKGRRSYTGDITKAKIFKTKKTALKNMQYFQSVITAIKTEKGFIIL